MEVFHDTATECQGKNEDFLLMYITAFIIKQSSCIRMDWSRKLQSSHFLQYQLWNIGQKH